MRRRRPREVEAERPQDREAAATRGWEANADTRYDLLRPLPGALCEGRLGEPEHRHDLDRAGGLLQQEPRLGLPRSEDQGRGRLKDVPDPQLRYDHPGAVRLDP